MKLALELIKQMSDYYSNNNLKAKMNKPTNQEYLEILKTNVSKNFLNLSGEKDFEEEIKYVPNHLMVKLDLVVKGSIFLYLNEILSWNEVKKLLNIGSTGVTLYKTSPSGNLGAYDIILSLLAVLFGKVRYATASTTEYAFKRLTSDLYYWDQPTYHYGYKSALSYTDINDILDNIDWFIDENNEQTIGLPTKYDILGMLRINGKFAKYIIEENNLDDNIETEMDNLGLYNIALNIIRLDNAVGLNNILFDFYKSIKENTSYSDDYISYSGIEWNIIRLYSKYIDIVMDLDQNYTEIEKIGNIIRNIQNFLIH